MFKVSPRSLGANHANMLANDVGQHVVTTCLLLDYLIWLMLNYIDRIYIIKYINEILRMLLCAFEIMSSRIK